VIHLAKPLIGPAEIAAVEEVLQSGNLVQGVQVASFEEEFSQLVDGRPCVAVNSGTSALHVALLALGIGPGDEVVVPSFTFAATANAVRLAGATPVFADILPDHYGLDPAAVGAAVTERTAAVMPVHLFGHPVADDLRRLAEARGLAMVEDAAQAHAASLHGRPVGTWGRAAAFSFYATKNMTTGEGGMVVLEDAAAARVARLLRNQGMDRQYENEIVGFNVRMTDVAAAMGRVQLRRLDELNGRRIVNAAILDGILGGAVPVPTVAEGAVHVYHQYTVRVPAGDRDRIQEALTAAGVGSKVFYPIPVHRLAPFDLALDLPETELAAAEVLSIPVAPHLTDAEVIRVGEALLEAVGA